MKTLPEVFSPLQGIFFSITVYSSLGVFFMVVALELTHFGTFSSLVFLHRGNVICLHLCILNWGYKNEPTPEGAHEYKLKRTDI